MSWLPPITPEPYPELTGLFIDDAPVSFDASCTPTSLPIELIFPLPAQSCVSSPRHEIDCENQGVVKREVVEKPRQRKKLKNLNGVENARRFRERRKQEKIELINKSKQQASLLDELEAKLKEKEIPIPPNKLSQKSLKKQVFAIKKLTSTDRKERNRESARRSREKERIKREQLTLKVESQAARIMKLKTLLTAHPELQ
jgi:flagellar biosynthesis GTPase FlhF